MGAQIDLELIVQSEIGQTQERPAVDEIDDVDATEVLLDVEDPTAGDPGSVGEKRVIDAAVRHYQKRLPVFLAEHRVEKTNPALLYLAEAFSAQVGLVPVGRVAFEKPLYFLEHLDRGPRCDQFCTWSDFSQVGREQDRKSA